MGPYHTSITTFSDRSWTMMMMIQFPTQVGVAKIILERKTLYEKINNHVLSGVHQLLCTEVWKKVKSFGYEKSVQNARKILRYVRKLEIPTFMCGLISNMDLKIWKIKNINPFFFFFFPWIKSRRPFCLFGLQDLGFYKKKNMFP